MVDRYMSAALSVALRDMLAKEAMTYDTLVLRAGISKPRVARWVKTNRANIHVAGWAPDKNGRMFLAMFRWGAAPDLPRPGRALTPAEQMRKQRQKRATLTTTIKETP